MNHVILTGRLTADATATSSKSAAFQLAVYSPRERRTDILHITATGKMMENCTKYLVEGTRILVRGRVQQDKEYGAIIAAESMEFMDIGGGNTANLS